MARQDPHFRLRIPEELKRRIEATAQANSRSITAEIVDRLEKSFPNMPDSAASLASEIDDIRERLATIRDAVRTENQQRRKSPKA